MLRTNSLFKQSHRFFSKYFSSSHKWFLKVEGDDMYSMGITSYGLEKLGPVESFKFYEPAVTYLKSSDIGEVKTNKHHCYIETPISFQLEKINEKLKVNPSLINLNPETVWIFWGEVCNQDDLEELMNQEEYLHYVEKLRKREAKKAKEGLTHESETKPH